MPRRNRSSLIALGAAATASVTLDFLGARSAPAHAVPTSGSEGLPGFSGDVYQATFWPLTALTVCLAWRTRPKADASKLPEGFSSYQFRYLFVWFLAITADWLQGPYVYALYASYGYTGPEIARLFVAGFGSSMLCGLFIGSVADAWGRKFCALLYCVLYLTACVTKHTDDYYLLMLGRVLGGAATSLLFSTFECWMVAEHRRCGFSEALLRYMFGLMFFVQYLAAIGAGLLAQYAASAVPLTRTSESSMWHYGGYTTPFAVSAAFLAVAIPSIQMLWKENYGEQAEGVVGLGQLAASFQAGGRAMCSNWRVPVLGLTVAAFESSMYAFVFNWTPALDSGASNTPPHGLIFSMFMMACMCGSSCFSLLDSSTSPLKVLLPVCALAAVSLGAVAMTLGGSASAAVTFMSFLMFEACVGAYFPAVSTVKSEVVPEEARAGVYNVYRVPLNLFVVLVLLTDMSLATSFRVCCGLLFFAAGSVGILGASSKSA